MSTPPLGPEDGNAVCPECGDEAFFVDNAQEGKPDNYAFSCDSCDYYITVSEHPRVAEIAVELGMRAAELRRG